jgi:hypothetical protein
MFHDSIRIGLGAYVQQLLRWRADDPAQKLGGLVLEVKGDFCSQVRSMLAAANREADYLEVGLNTGVCYNSLHNDLDPYAVAYAIGSLLNNLFGKSKEPFWQQAYTDLLKFVISLRRITDGYTTLAEVYRYIIEDSRIDKNIRTLEDQFTEPAPVIVIEAEWLQGDVKQACTLWTWLRQYRQYADAVVTRDDLIVTSANAGHWMADPIAFSSIEKEHLIRLGNALVLPEVPHRDPTIRKHHLCGGRAFFVALVPPVALAAHVIDRNGRSVQQRVNREFRHRATPMD